MAKKKQCQLAVLTLTEEKMSVWKTRDCSEAVLAMAMDGVFICAALSTEYVVYNMDKMSLTPLFPLDPAISRVPNILRIDRDEFLVLGPGNLGMFVTSAGVAGRPPVQWSAGVSHVTYAAPHLVCQGQEMVAVYDIGDQSIKQGLSYPGARFVGFYDGTLLLASSSTIDTLVAVPLAQQAEAMLESGHLEDAVRLARDTRAGDIVRQKAAFMFLKTGQLDRAQELLLGAAVDVREVLSLYPGMLPSDSKFVRADPPLHDIPDISSVKAALTESEITLEQFLVLYLRALMARAGAYLEHATEVHTALVKVLTTVDPSQVEDVINDDASVIDLDELTDFFEEGGHHHFLATLNWKFQQQEAAVDSWTSLLRGDSEDAQFPGLEFFCRLLSSCSEQMIHANCDTALATDQIVGARIFMKPTLQVQDDATFIDSALNILSKYPVAKTEFLKFLVFDKKSEVEKHHTQLAMTFISSVKTAGKSRIQESEGSGPLSKLILTSRHLNARFLLHQLADTELHYERAVLHGKLGEHERALDILVNTVQRPVLAETYCDDMGRDQPDTRAALLLALLTIYLNPANRADTDHFTSLAVDLINSRAADLNGAKVISLLPDHWNISIILPALRTFSRQLLHHSRMASVKKNLHKSRHLQLTAQLLAATRAPVCVRANHYCPVCKKSFVAGPPGALGAGLVRFPNGVVVHAACAPSRNICPVTGEVFSIQ